MTIHKLQSELISFIFVLLFSFCFFSTSHSQTTSNAFSETGFEQQVLKYQPHRRASVSEEDFNKGVFFLDETKAAVKNNPQNFNEADYWNVTMAFLNLGEPKEHIELAFKKAIEMGPQSICAYIKSLGGNSIAEAIPEIYYPFVAKCGTYQAQEEDPINIAEYCKEYDLDSRLVQTIYQIYKDDQRYRMNKPVDWSKQTPLDKANQEKIEKLYTKYQTYIGRDLVGKEFETTMWSVIQHSNKEMMDKYLPVIFEEVQKGKLDEVALKLLIDRLYLQQYGYQIFGSQVGKPIAEESIREKVKKKYGME